MPDNPQQGLNGSVVTLPRGATTSLNDRLSDYIIFAGNAADSIPEWGTAPRDRDRQLRTFWTTESILAGAMLSISTRYAGLQWELDGPDKMVSMYTRILHSSQHGLGWNALAMSVAQDYLGQDNGAFIEVMRTDDLPTAPVIQLNHLDSNQCMRTGVPATPVVYYDANGDAHLLKWYQVIMLTEMPSPIERQRGRQVCAISRVLRAAQLMRDVSTYKRERATGQDSKQIHVVTGVSTQKIEDAIGASREQSTAQGMVRYTRAVVVGSINPEAKAAVATIDLAKLPDGYDEEKAQRDYITVLAMCFGVDYQDLAPLPTGSGMGSGAQAEVLALKARGRGPTMWMRNFEFYLNYHGILPQNVTFTYGSQDSAQDLDNAKLRVMRAEERAMRITSGEISPEVARMLALESGDLTQDQMDALASYVAPSAQLATAQAKNEALGPKTDMQEGGTPAASVKTA